MANLDPRIAAVTDRIIERSKPGRKRYLDLVADEAARGIDRKSMSCGNFAHGFAAAGDDKDAIRTFQGPNLGIVTAYNDMLSAHAPYYRYPEQMKLFAREVGATAQVAGGVPAMCDGVTQGQPGMDLSLFSRDNIAGGTAIALSHGMFDGVAMLGICDKIVPGLLIGALRFGHLPAIFVPAGPMPSGLANKEKQRVRQLFADSKVHLPTQEDWKQLQAEVAEHGMYNAYLQAVPPTGSISYINHSTSSIHPIVSKIEIRKEGKIGRVYYPAPYMTNDNLEYYEDAYEIGYEKIVDTYAAATQHVDQGLSLTLFFKDTATTREVNKAQIYAWRKGIKTMYYSRIRQLALEGTEIEGCVSCML